MRQENPLISEEEKMCRKAAIDFARGSVFFEGITLPARVEEINQRFITGNLTIDEHIAAIRALAFGY
jgi:hypothetical protein